MVRCLSPVASEPTGEDLARTATAPISSMVRSDALAILAGAVIAAGVLVLALRAGDQLIAPTSGSAPPTPPSCGSPTTPSIASRSST